VPTSTVEDQKGDGTDADAFADFGQTLFMASILTSGTTRAASVPRAGQMAPNTGRPGEPPIAPDARTRAVLGPDAGQGALLANAGFILT